MAHERKRVCVSVFNFEEHLKNNLHCHHQGMVRIRTLKFSVQYSQCAKLKN